MFKTADLNILDLARQPLERWKYQAIQETDEENDNISPAKDDNQIIGWCRTLVPCRLCSSRVLSRLILVVTILLLLANLASLYGQRLSQLKPNPVPDDEEETSEEPAGTDWSRYAYSQYVTNHNYLCNSLMLYERLHTLGSEAERLIMYPENWYINESNPSPEALLLLKARDDYHVNLVPIQVQHLKGEATWADSFTKLLAFNQTQYDRVISLDSDSTLLQPMDELFLLPPSTVAMPRAYWLDDDSLSSQIVVLEPSVFEFRRILKAMATRDETQFDMEIVNDLYGKACTIIPHRGYDLLTGEFKAQDHHRYLGTEEEPWDGRKVLEEAKFLHFSDWPFPKPWLDAPEELRIELEPPCKQIATDIEDCTDRDLWNGFYADFKQRRVQVCGTDYEVEPKQEAPSLHRRQYLSPFEPIF